MRDSLKTYIRDLKETTAAKERLESELKIARNIQMDMLPKGTIGGGEKDGFELAATLVPAREVGGDLYYHFLADGRVAFLVGDVSGKGVPAALFMARTKTLFETIAGSAGDVGDALASVNRSLCRENEAGMFVTVFAGVFDPSTGKLRCAAGGHDPPALLPGDGRAPRFLDIEGGPLLGLLDQAEFPTHEVVLSPQDSIVITTDGVSEASDAEGDFFTEERLLAALTNLGRASALEISDKVLGAVRDYAGTAPQSDDITIMTLRYVPAG
jgi:sigma-B regulation protein RsbU (phosphoserine phosphatase)